MTEHEITRRGLIGSGLAIAGATMAGEGAGMAGERTASRGEASAPRIAFVTWLEGAAVTTAGDFFFSDVFGDRQYRLRRGAGTPTIFRERANFPNGAIVDDGGRLITCEAGNSRYDGVPRVTSTDLATGERTTLIERVAGKRLMGPNDVRIDAAGHVWFTDGGRPPFLPALRAQGPHVEGTGVYRIADDGSAKRVLGPSSVAQPNGLGFSRDGRFLFVNDDDASPGGGRLLLRFSLGADGSATDRTVLHDFGRGRSGDGMVVDSDGHLALCAGLSKPAGPVTAEVPAGVHFFDADGRYLGFVPVPEDNCTNLVEHPDQPGRFLVTAGRGLYDIRKSAIIPA